MQAKRTGEIMAAIGEIGQIVSETQQKVGTNQQRQRRAHHALA